VNDIDRFKFSLQNAFEGIKITLRTQRNLRIHIIVGLLIISVSFLLKIDLLEFVLILLTVMIVLVTEILNTAIEFTIDLVSPQYNQLAKKVKDISAAAVLVSAFFAILIGLFILGPRLITLLGEILQEIF